MDVVVIGAAMTDVVGYAPKFPSFNGEVVFGNGYSVSFGGKGGNQAVGIGRLGANVTLLARVGEDSFGEGYRNHLKKENVKTDYLLATKDTASGIVIAIINDKDNHGFLAFPGADRMVTLEDIMAAETLIKDSRVLLCTLEVDPSVLVKAMQLAQTNGVKTVLNTAPLFGMGQLSSELFTSCDVLVPNALEAAQLTGQETETQDGAVAAAKILQDRGCRSVVITLGSRGALVVDVNRHAHLVQAEQVETVDSLGAGDMFCASLAFYLSCMPSLPLPEAVARATTIATQTVIKAGAQSSYPQRNELPERLFQMESS